jgi:hypothetical protein
MRTALFPALLVLAACSGAPFTVGPGDAVDAAEAGDPDAPGDERVAGDGGPSGAGGDAQTDAAGDAGESSAPDAPSSCLTTLSGAGTGDFSIAFTIATTTTLQMAIANQREGCADGSSFWDVIVDSSGGVVVTMNDGTASHLVTLEAGNSVNDGKPHAVLITRKSGRLVYERDGVVGSAYVEDLVDLANLPPLTVGSDACPGTVPTIGTLSDLCITVP